MTNNDKNVININAFDILMKTASNNFENSKIPYSRSFELSERQKKRIVDKKCKLAASANRCQSFTAKFFIVIKIVEI